MLNKYSQGGCTAEEFKQMQAEFNKTASFLSPLLEFLGRSGYTDRAPEPYHHLLTELSKSSPMCALLHPCDDLDQLIEDLHNVRPGDLTNHTNTLRRLHLHCPLLWQLVAELGCMKEEILPLVQQMYMVAKQAFISQKEGAQGTCAIPGEKNLQCFPHLPMKRPRGRFLLDTVRKPEGPADGCRKYSGHHSTLIPGLFTLFCGHGVCYGFSVMESSESVNIPFTILRTRFQTGPRVVIYDNACKLHSYALNRDPEFFKTTWFLVDRLHWRNHSGCNCGYNADLYPQFSGVNTQIAEQFNSRLKRLKYHLPYMSRDHFIRHIQLYLWYHSRNTVLQCASTLPPP
ncbi:uncharacterized protein LOC143131543 [Alosa pseudoharengus]|uniref:uncharacterized protein LOC143131543 n=1 Tax=Alosa pseudoharengus TaxID=34774 RepID=UPI003F8B8D38